MHTYICMYVTNLIWQLAVSACTAKVMSTGDVKAKRRTHLEKGPYGLDNQHVCFGLILKFRSYGIQK